MQATSPTVHGFSRFPNILLWIGQFLHDNASLTQIALRTTYNPGSIVFYKDEHVSPSIAEIFRVVIPRVLAVISAGYGASFLPVMRLKQDLRQAETDLRITQISTTGMGQVRLVENQ